MKTGTRTGRLARLAPLTAAVAALLASPAAAQDVLRAGRAHGVEAPARAREILRRDSTAFEFRRAWRQKTERVRQARAALEARQGPRLSTARIQGAGAAVTGTLRIPVLLGLYLESTEPSPRQSYQDRLFGAPGGRYTAKTLYQEMSRGAFTLDGTAVGWLRLPLAGYFYSPRFNDDPYEGTKAFLYHALMAADSSVDFGEFDNDGPGGVPNSGDDDGYVDAAAFVYPAKPTSCGGPGIWPHRWTYASWWGEPFTTADPRAGGGTIRVDDYFITGGVACDNAPLLEIGTFSHEMGHALGLPDLYDTHYADGSYGEGLGEWDLMASGGYNHDESPAHMSAWTKDFLGWVNVETVTATRAGYTLPPVYRDGTVLRYDIPGTREYFLMEHRAAVGSDAFLHGPGLLVYHVDPVVIEANRFSNQVNGFARQGVDLEEADGLGHLDSGRNRGDAGDPFPGSTARASFGAQGLPGSLSNDSVRSGLELRAISMAGGALTLDVEVEVRLVASASPLRLSADGKGTAAGTLRISASDGSAVAVAAQSGQGWLTVSPSGAPTPATFSVTARGAELAAGMHEGTLTFSHAGSSTPLSVPVSFTVGGELLVGDSARSELNGLYDTDTLSLHLVAGDTVDVGAFALTDLLSIDFSLLNASGTRVAGVTFGRNVLRTAILAGFAVPETGTYRLVVRNVQAPPAYDGRPLPFLVRTRRAAPILDVIGSLPGAYLQEGSGPRADTVRVYSRGVGPAPFTVTVEGGEGWLSVSPTRGAAVAGSGTPAASTSAGERAADGDVLAPVDGGALRSTAAPGPPAGSGPAAAPTDPPVPVVVGRSVAGLAPGRYEARVVFNFPDDPWNVRPAYTVRLRVHPPGATVLDSTRSGYPGRVVLAPDGQLVISSAGRLVRMDPQTGASTLWVAGLPADLGGMEFGPDSALYVAGYFERKVLRVSPAGEVSTLFTTGDDVYDVDVGPTGRCSRPSAARPSCAARPAARSPRSSRAGATPWRTESPTTRGTSTTPPAASSAG